MVSPTKIRDKKRIIDVRHPFYSTSIENWRKWRLTYEGGIRFIREFLQKFSKREDAQAFLMRQAVTYCPAFAKSATNEVRNSLSQRFCDIAREGGDTTYQTAITGKDNGVDLLGSSMNTFIGRRCLPELLTMSRVGIFVDMPPLPETPTMADTKGKRPYVYWYPAEDILSWTLDDSQNPSEFTQILLADTVVEADGGDEFYLPYDQVKRYRHVWKDENNDVWVQRYDTNGDYCDALGAKVEAISAQPVKLGIKKIPFILVEITDSLLTDVAEYQIALLNLASSDIAYLLTANFPFYVEQFDRSTDLSHIKKEGLNKGNLVQTWMTPETSIVQARDTASEIKVGAATGRRYGKELDQPAFIHPSSEPLTASMRKQEQMKAEIRQLVQLAVINLVNDAETDTPSPSLEGGLAYIGLELEHAERKIAEYWAMYVDSKSATVKYPENYSLLTDDDRRKKADDLEELMSKLPSKTFQKEIAKQIARTLLGSKISVEKLETILAEIDTAEVINTDPEVIKSDFESGFVSLELASKARGYPKGQVEQAKRDHADRIARIAIAQTSGMGAGAPAKADLKNPGSRGASDLASNPNDTTDEKTTSRDKTLDADVKDKVRGEGQ